MIDQLSITQEDIDQGKQNNCKECPIALSYKRETGHECSVYSLFTSAVHIRDHFTQESFYCDKYAKQFVWQFDKNRDVKPINLSVYKSIYTVVDGYVKHI